MEETVNDIKTRIASRGISSWKDLFIGSKAIWAIYGLLTLVSLVFVYSASSMLVARNGGDSMAIFFQQALYLTIGAILVILTSQFVYRIKPVVCKNAAVLIYVFSVILLLMTFTSAFAVEVNGSTRWIRLFGLTIQPSEVAKLSLVLMIASIISKNVETVGHVADKRKALYPILICSGIVILLVLKSNFSTAMFIALIVFVMMALGGIPFKQMASVCAIVGFVVMLMGYVIVAYPEKLDAIGFNRAYTWQTRIVSFVPDLAEVAGIDSEEAEKHVDNHQVTMSKIAIANGKGLLGKGPGNSIQRDKLSQAYCDFIYAIIIEETGWAGTVIVLLLYLALGWRALKIAEHMRHSFDVLVVLGLSFVMSTQAFLHMAVVVNLLPATGQTLPIISAGGSSLLITSIEFGLILGISHYANNHKPETKTETKNDKK